jgi:hypothetical protein
MFVLVPGIQDKLSFPGLVDFLLSDTSVSIVSSVFFSEAFAKRMIYTINNFKTIFKKSIKIIQNI